MKPGWCRVGLHWVMDDIEVYYIINAVLFIARYGYRFLSLYDFDLCSVTWAHKKVAPTGLAWSLEVALCSDEV